MSETAIIILSDLATLVMSIVYVSFAVGRSFGEIRHDITDLKHDVGEIKGMFVMRLRRDNIDQEG